MPITIPFRVDKLWGFCDTLGNILMPPAYDSIGFFELCPAKQALFQQQGRWGILDEQFNIVVPAKYEAIELLGDEKTGYILIYDKGKKGLMDASYEAILPTQYDSIGFDHRYSGYLIAGLNGKLGVFTLGGSPLSKLVFDRCFVYSKWPPLKSNTSELLSDRDMIGLIGKKYYKVLPAGGIQALPADIIPQPQSMEALGNWVESAIKKSAIEDIIRNNKINVHYTKIHLDRKVDNTANGDYRRILLEDENGLFYMIQMLPVWHQNIMQTLLGFIIFGTRQNSCLFRKKRNTASFQPTEQPFILLSMTVLAQLRTSLPSR
ncbi:MAG: WG repeat-containing protein [Saprospirales bacterium]|nr:WG repeat-containing protein [Saprospirales bacterium]